MSTSEPIINIRKALLYDLRNMFAIDQAIRDTGLVPATYEGFTTKHIFGLDQTNVDTAKRSSLLGEVAKLLDLAFIAELEGHACGFIVGRHTYIVERDTEIGEIALLGVHPNYQHKGVAAKLVNALCDLFRSRSILTVLTKLDPRDKVMQAFFKRIGFTGEELISYQKSI